MYKEKIEDILSDIENKEVDIAGGAIVGMNLSIVNSLIIYISNLTIGKKNYMQVQDEVKSILSEAEKIKKDCLNIIDGDKQILEEILNTYKLRKDKPDEYERVCIKAVDFCMGVLNNAFDTIKLAERISKVGNRMLASDFKICALYSSASIESAIVNVEINLNSIEDESFKNKVRHNCNLILEEAIKIKNNILNR